VRKTCFLFLLLMLCLSASPVRAQTQEGDFVYVIDGGKAKITAYTGSADTLTVPDTLGGYPVTSISYYAFSECDSLSHVALPQSLTSIGSSAFHNCSSLVQVDLPDSLVMIGTHAFYGCAKLTQITLPESIERVHPYAFYGCSAVRNCRLDGQAALTLTNYGYPFTSAEYPLITLMAHEDDAGKRTFTVADCDESAVSVSFPEGVTAIGGYAFFNCTVLTEIAIPDGVREIPYSAFEGCSSLEQIILPGSVIRIDDSAFLRCPQITIVAPEGSAAHAFAIANSLPWRAR